MVTMTESGANAKKIRNSVLYESEEETKEIISKLSKSERKSVISEIDRHDDVNLLGFLAIKDQDAAIKQILKDVELDAANLEAVQWALEDAIVCGNEKLTKMLMVRFSEITKGLPVSKREQVESDLMVAACNKSKSNKSSIIQLLYDHGFRVRRVVENDLVTDQQKSMQNTEYHYELYQEIKAQCCPHYSAFVRKNRKNPRKHYEKIKNENKKLLNIYQTRLSSDLPCRRTERKKARARQPHKIPGNLLTRNRRKSAINLRRFNDFRNRLTNFLKDQQSSLI